VSQSVNDFLIYFPKAEGLNITLTLQIFNIMRGLVDRVLILALLSVGLTSFMPKRMIPETTAAERERTLRIGG
jgi:hypothetical protein